MNLPIPEIQTCHALYESLTGHPTRLDMAREHFWFDWLRFRPHQPFTADDLKTVIMWIVKEFKAKRRPSLAGLRFEILIGQPQDFEQLLNQIRAEQRAKTQINPLRILRKSEPITKTETAHSTHVSEVLKQVPMELVVRAMREACNE